MTPVIGSTGTVLLATSVIGLSFLNAVTTFLKPASLIVFILSLVPYPAGTTTLVSSLPASLLNTGIFGLDNASLSFFAKLGTYPFEAKPMLAKPFGSSNVLVTPKPSGLFWFTNLLLLLTLIELNGTYWLSLWTASLKGL